MYRNYFKIAFRNLLKNKLFSAITILGLAVGLSAGLLIFQYVHEELSYDTFHKHADDIYRVYLDIYKHGNRDAQSARVAPAVASVFQTTFPSIDTYTRLVILGPDGVLTYEDQYSSEAGIYLADSAFFDVFSFPLLQGNPRTALNEPFCAVITQETARTLFGEENPVGKNIVIDAENFDGASPTFKVTGVLEKVPENSHLQFGVLLSYPTLFEFVGHQFDESWQWNNTYTYVRLHPDTHPATLETKFPDVVHRFNGSLLAEQDLDWQYRLQPITDIHLHSDLQHEASVNGNAFYVHLLATIGVLILLIAYINFVNLTTVKALQRAKEVGIRKVSGAYKGQLIFQFFIEALLINVIAWFLGLLLLKLTLPFFSKVFGSEFSFALQHPSRLWWGVGLWLCLLMVGSGFYPAFVLSRYKPAKVLKGSLTNSKSGIAFRKSLVIGQFAIALVLVTVTLIADRQIRYMQQQNLGFRPEQIIVVRSPKSIDYGYENNLSRFRNEVHQWPQVESVSGSSAVPGQEIYWYDDRIRVNGQETTGVFSWLAVDQHYFSQFDIPLLSGRWFTEPARDRWIINETALRLLGFDSPQEAIGQQLRREEQSGEIIGVVQDFHQESLKTAIEPMLFFCGQEVLYFTVKLKTDQMPPTLKALEATYQELFPGSPYEYFFLDEFFDRQYKADQQFSTLFRLFSGLAIFIACLGLFALSSYAMFLRTKEIGIRKVMGASVTHLLLLLSQEYIKLIGIALLIAIPVANYVATEWLQNFAFHIDITGWLLIFPGVFILCIALFTVSSQTLKAATQNPVDSLRYE